MHNIKSIKKQSNNRFSLIKNRVLLISLSRKRTYLISLIKN
ncbi:hypothetical protein JCM19294_331 [Nonlabens tegetincola]|uniref:Uncharacterized protein n=1 Tax=Nonlabens tegetincola TaxID=323273 RepID=A0A090Q6G3_9FLAO|nr:hypothetical protein JCM19294_331 [Nonlabens tegetincola]